MPARSSSPVSTPPMALWPIGEETGAWGASASVDAAVTMALGILKGLAHLHSREIVHRDLKPGNILLKCEVPCIADFGLVRILRTDISTYRIAGTPAYMSPEISRGERGEGGDLWAVAVMLYEMLVGKRPFSGTDLDDWRRAITTADPAPLPESLPATLRAVIDRALQRDEADGLLRPWRCTRRC